MPEHRFPQLLLDVHDEIIVDLFAGGGGASLGIEMATGRQVDIAINHDAAAVALHRANHPQTTHHVVDVFEADPREVTQGRAVGLLWASPDCTDHSKAKGGKPIRTRKRRALAWVVKRWAGQVRPRVIALENVEEFVEWGPLVGPPGQLRRCARRKGKTFRRFVRDLEQLGYVVEWRELRACDYGAPTIRKRLFLVARCDGEPIVWPEATHGPGTRRAYRTAAECIDWSIPMLSIFASKAEAKAWARERRAEGWRMGTPKRPLAEATLRRIARGVQRFVVEAAEPFIVSLAHGYSGGRREFPMDGPIGTQHSGGNKFAVVAPVVVANNTNNAPHSIEEPLPTVTGGGRNILAAPFMVPRYGEREGQEPRTRSLEEPAPAIVPTGNGGSLVASFLAKHYGGNESPGWPLGVPISSVTTQDHHHLVAASMTKLRGTSSDADPAEPLHTVSAGGTHHGLVAAHVQRDFGESVGHAAGEPLHTVTPGGGGKAALVSSFLSRYHGQGTGSRLDEPTSTLTAKDRLGLVTVELAGEPYVLVDIAMRMLQPRELYRAQGFPDSYRIDRGADGRRLTKTEMVRMVGNSVAPPVAAAIVRANCPRLVARDEALEVVA